MYFGHLLLSCRIFSWLSLFDVKEYNISALTLYAQKQKAISFNISLWGLSSERHLYHLRMATGILNFIDSGFSTANNYRDGFQHWILFVTTKFFYTSNLYNLGYPEHFIQAHLKHLYRHGRTFSVPKTVFVVYKIARNPPVVYSRDIGKLMPAK